MQCYTHFIALSPPLHRDGRSKEISVSLEAEPGLGSSGGPM